MRKGAFVLAVSLLLAVAQPASAASYSVTGKARWNDRLVLSFATTVPGDIIATAEFSGSPSWVKIWVVNTAVPAECQALNQPATTVTCAIVDAPAGPYRAEFWPSSGNLTATLTVQAP